MRTLVTACIYLAMAAMTVMTAMALEAQLEVSQWYPQGLDVVWECKATGAAGELSYDWEFGDGQVLYDQTASSNFHTYQGSGEYIATCAVYDSTTQELAVASSTVSVEAPAASSNSNSSTEDTNTSNRSSAENATEVHETANPGPEQEITVQQAGGGSGRASSEPQNDEELLALLLESEGIELGDFDTKECSVYFSSAISETPQYKHGRYLGEAKEVKETYCI